jgi:hypothetical protein
MKNKSIANAIKKLNLKIENYSNGRQFVRNNGKVLSWYIQGDNAVCVHLSRESDKSDPYTDYLPGSFAHTLKRAISYIGDMQ